MPRNDANDTRAKARKLKVFQAQFGFYDSVVAATSQTAALRAWGTHQNLFADGQASVASDAAAVQAALSHPNLPLRRALGFNGAFELEPSTLPGMPDQASASRERTKAKNRSKTRPDRSALGAAETALTTLDANRKVEESEFRKRQNHLNAEIAKAAEGYLDQRKNIKAALVAARAAYRKAGGSD